MRSASKVPWTLLTRADEVDGVVVFAAPAHVGCWHAPAVLFGSTYSRNWGYCGPTVSRPSDKNRHE